MTSAAQLKLLLPLDGSKMAESVLPIVEILATGLELKTFLLHLIESNPPLTIHGEQHLRNIVDAEEYLRGIENRLKTKISDLEIHVHSNKVDNVAQGIIEHAEESCSDWILLATHGSGGMKELLFGSIAQQVLHHGKWPVLLIPPQIAKADTEMKMEKIVIPYDLVHSQEPALQLAAKLAKAFNAEIDLVLVVPTLEKLRGERVLAQRFMPNAMEAMLDLNEQDALEQMSEIALNPVYTGIKIKYKVLRGDVILQIANYLEREKGDLLVVSSHGHHGVNALLEGSIAARLIRKTSKPLLMVRSD